MFNLGLQELVVVFLIVFLLFGAKSLPDVARGLGETIKAIRKELRGLKEEVGNEDSSSDSSKNV